jgi:5'-deoxynucleotidase YfbR-like HD superfamily hydrolase
MIENLSNNDILLAQHVKRWHMIRMQDKQSVAEHSYNVAMLTIKMLRDLDKEGSYGITAEEQLSVIEWALCHDIHEIEHGDVPSPSGVDRGDTEVTFWDKRRRETGPSFEARNFVCLMDKVEAYIYFHHHGFDGKRNGKYISDYLRDRVDQSLSQFSAPIQDYVRELIDDATELYCD